MQRVLWMVAGVLVSACSASAQDTAVLDAARARETELVADLLRDGTPADATQPDGATALHWAAHHDDVVMARALIDHGADVGAANELGATPLWLACLNASASMVETLLSAGADPDAALPSGETVLMTASRTGSVEAVRTLVAHGAQLDTQEDTRGQTALMWAVSQGHRDVVTALIELGADVGIRSTPQPRRIHTRTAGFNPTGVVDAVLGGNSALLFAARVGDLEIMKALVAVGGDVNDTAPLGTSALVVAVHSGHTAVALYLLGQGADPNAAEAGYGALHAAALRGDEVIARALLGRGADPDAVVVRGSRGRRNSPDYVIEHDMVGATPFWLAARFLEPGIMQALVEHGATVEVAREGLVTPLLAVSNARRRREPGLAADATEVADRILEAARIALDSGVAVDAVDAQGNTALHLAARRRLDEVVTLLAEHGAPLDVENADGQTPLMLAGGDGDEGSTATLLRRLRDQAE